jgi:hypothetical protein
VTKHTVLFLAANPLATSQLGLDEEVRAIEEEFDRSGRRGRFEFVARWAAQPLDMLRELGDRKPTVLHFCDHDGINFSESANENADVEDTWGLYFLGQDGREQFVSAKALQQVFGVGSASVKLVVLSAAHSAAIAKALLAHVDCVIGFAGSIQDDATRAYMIGFYGGLAAGNSVAKSHRMGCAAISIEGLPGSDQPRLMTRKGVDAERVVFVDDKPTASMVLRDVSIGDGPRTRESARGRNLLAVIGIDHYRDTERWKSLSNAVSDARGAAALFEQLGFAQAAPALLDGAATGRAIWSLVTDELVTVGADDSVIIFYAGHGGNRKHRVGDREVATGYLIPADAEDKVSTWVELEAWLRAVALLPARHILVILDACHSGIALDPMTKWRDGASSSREPLSTLSARRSRRIITSALEDERAVDGGPIPGHSLFTGCLIEALTHGLCKDSEPATTGSELWLYVRRRVRAFPNSQQTPDFGTFAYDERGELVIPLRIDRSVQEPKAPANARETQHIRQPDVPAKARRNHRFLGFAGIVIAWLIVLFVIYYIEYNHQ